MTKARWPILTVRQQGCRNGPFGIGRPGDFWWPGSATPLRDGAEGILVIPCGYRRKARMIHEFAVLVAESVETDAWRCGLLPCTGEAEITFSRKWTAYFLQFQHPERKTPLPTFSRKYRLRTTRLVPRHSDFDSLAESFG
jgi:hypothetical protein